MIQIRLSLLFLTMIASTAAFADRLASEVALPREAVDVDPQLTRNDSYRMSAVEEACMIAISEAIPSRKFLEYPVGPVSYYPRNAEHGPSFSWSFHTDQLKDDEFDPFEKRVPHSIGTYYIFDGTVTEVLPVDSPQFKTVRPIQSLTREVMSATIRSQLAYLLKILSSPQTYFRNVNGSDPSKIVKERHAQLSDLTAKCAVKAWNPKAVAGIGALLRAVR